MRTSYGTFALGLVVAIAACGGGDDSLTAKEAIIKNAERICGKAFECKDSSPFGDQFETIVGANEAECKMRLLTDPDSSTPDQVQASVDAGRITYDEADAKVCLAYDPTCPAFWGVFMNMPDPNVPAECRTAFVATVQTGGDCVITDDCASGNDACTGGKCTTQPPPQPLVPEQRSLLNDLRSSFER